MAHKTRVRWITNELEDYAHGVIEMRRFIRLAQRALTQSPDEPLPSEIRLQLLAEANRCLDMWEDV